MNECKQSVKGIHFQNSTRTQVVTCMQPNNYRQNIFQLVPYVTLSPINQKHGHGKYAKASTLV